MKLLVCTLGFALLAFGQRFPGADTQTAPSQAIVEAVSASTLASAQALLAPVSERVCHFAAECGTITIKLDRAKNGDITVFVGVVDEASGEVNATTSDQYPKNTSPVGVLAGDCAYAVWPNSDQSYTWEDVYDAADPCELLVWVCHCGGIAPTERAPSVPLDAGPVPASAPAEAALGAPRGARRPRA